MVQPKKKCFITIGRRNTSPGCITLSMSFRLSTTLLFMLTLHVCLFPVTTTAVMTTTGKAYSLLYLEQQSVWGPYLLTIEATDGVWGA